MTTQLHSICPYCGEKFIMDTYSMNGHVECIAYCDNEKCSVKPCTDSTYPSRMFAEILAITGEKE